MGILGSVGRYLKARGRLLYTEGLGWHGGRVGRVKRGNTARWRYAEFMEPRLLMTTLYGGEAFQYTGSAGTVTVTLTGNVAAELIASEQTGGLDGGGTATQQNSLAISTIEGNLIFGDIEGKITSGPRAGTVIGNGSMPSTQGTGNGAINTSRVAIPNLSYNSVGDQINVEGIASNLNGATYALNSYDVDATGAVIQNNGSTQWTVQILQLSSGGTGLTGAATILNGNPSVGGNPIVPLGAQSLTISGAAVNPLNGQLYFEVNYTIQNNSTGGSNTTYVDEMYAYNMTTNTITDVGALNLQNNSSNAPEMNVQAMTFVVNATAPTTATLYIAEQPNSNAVQPRNGATSTLVPSLAEFAVPAGGTVSITTASNTLDTFDGFGTARIPLSGVVGLAALPGSDQGGGSRYMFAAVSAGTTGASSHMVRIDLQTGEGTDWGSTVDLGETSNALVDNGAVDGNAFQGLTFNPTAIDPLTGEPGAFLSVDSATGDLDFVNHQFRVSQGDVYAVYTNTADINAAITFEGGNLYGGTPGTIAGVTLPANTGTVFIGARGEIPNVAPLMTFSSGNVFLTGQLTNQIGILPSQIEDITDPTTATTAPATNKLFAGLMVGNSLETPYITTGNLTDNLLGSGFSDTSGLAVSNNGTIAVMESGLFGESDNAEAFGLGFEDVLGFVDPTTGTIDGPLLNIHLANGTLLKNVEGMAYGDVNLTGTDQLYAIYNLGNGNGPTLGTINTVTGVFTPVAAGMGLGPNAKVTAMAFTPGPTGFDPTHESLYIAADPNINDDNNSETLYRVTVSTAQVVSAPSYGAGGILLAARGQGVIRDQSGNPLEAISATFDASSPANLLMLDGLTGRLMDVNVTSGVAGANVATIAGSVNPTVSGVAFDPATLQFLAVDNLTGTNTFEGATSSTSDSAILMTLKSLTDTNASAVDLGKFLVDGVFTGKVYVSGSMDMFYAGDLVAGDSTSQSAPADGEWLVSPGLDGNEGERTDESSTENYFQNNFYAGGDIRDVLSLTNIAATTEITAGGRIGQVLGDGTVSAVVHAENQSDAPIIVDSTSLNGFGGTTPLAFTINGGMEVADDIAELSELPSEAGSVYNSTPQPIDTFTTNFTFNAFGTGGFAFVLQNSSLKALGGSGNGLGYSGIGKSAAIEFTLNPNDSGNSSSTIGEIGFAIDGQISQAIMPGDVDFSYEDTIDATLTYDGSHLVLTLNDEDLGTTFTASFAANLVNIVGAHSAYVGFTMGSGTEGALIEVSGFNYAGSEPGQESLPQQEVQHFTVDSDYTFAAGYIVNNGTTVPFDNRTPQGAQYLGSIENAIAGQPDVIDLQGDLDGDQPTPQTPEQNDTADYYAFGALAGQSIQVTVIPREDPSLSDADEDPIDFGVFDPDGRLIASDYSTWDDVQVQDRTISFTTTIPGLYKIAIENNGTPTWTNELTPGEDNDLYEMTITGVGDIAVGGVIAGTSMTLPGSDWIANSATNTGSATINPSIYANVGDVGAIVSGNPNGTTGTITAPISVSGLSQTQSPTTGYSIAADSSEDIAVYNGNLRAVISGSIGTPDILVNGSVGLMEVTTPPTLVNGVLQGGQLEATFTIPATGDIQTLDSAGDISGDYRTDKAIGVIRADNQTANSDTTEFHVDVDRLGNDGIIDMIDVTGDWGTLNSGGAALITGPGGNVRFMTVGGTVWQDPIFSNGQTGTYGEIVHAPGPVTLEDDSGALVTLTPSTVTTTTTNGTASTTTTTQGQLTTLTYGVRGAGGQVILAVDSTAGLTVNVTAGGEGRSAEIGTISVAGAAAAVTVTNGIPSVSTASTAANNVIITSSGNARVDVFNITDAAAANGTASAGGTIDTISNTTGGDIVNVTAGDIGSIISDGNIGTMMNTTGAELDPITVFSNTYPFEDQRYGISAGNIGTLQAYGSIGNILASGVIGTITPDAGPGLPDQFDGIDGPIVANGTAAGATTNALTAAVSISHVNIGEGIEWGGSGSMSLAGIFAAGQILTVTGTNADIRGPIVSQSAIGAITLNGGSIIDGRIEVVSSLDMASELFTGTYNLPESTPNIDNPVYNINNITINGNGGIIGTQILGASINSITVNGFGIVNTEIAGLGDGTINSITAAGLGLRAVYINDAVVNSITATGNGTFVSLSSYPTDVRESEADPLFDPSAGLVPSDLTDLDVYIYGDGVVSGPDPGGLQTGLIDDTFANGQDALGNVSAYTMLDSGFYFPEATGNLTARHDINDVQIITGSVKSVSIANDALNFELTAAGKIGNVNIGGDFIAGTDTTVTNLSQIVAKGASGDIGNVTINGNFGAVLQADSSLGAVTIGQAGVKGAPSSGDFSGTIIVGANHLPNAQLNILKLFGSILGGVIDVVGSVGTIDIAHDFASLAETTVVNGNVGSLIVGDDPAVNGSDFSAPLTITGNLGSATITGQMTGTLTVQGNVGSYTINSDPSTVGTSLLTGGLIVGGTLTTMSEQGPFTGTLLAGYINSFSTGGDVSGRIVAGMGINTLTVNGNLLQTGQVVSSLGGIQKLAVTGTNLDGTVIANNGAIGALTVNGSIGATAAITALSIGSLTIPGLVSGTVSAAQGVTAVSVGGVAVGGVVSGGGISAFTTKGDMLGTLDAGFVAAGSKETIGGNLGGTSVFTGPATIAVTGNMLAGAMLTDTQNLTSLAVKGSLNGDVLVDREIKALTSGSVNGAMVVAGLGIASLKVTGAVNDSIIATGLARGADGIYGTGDLGEQPRMADLTAAAVGPVTNTIMAIGGNIGTFKATGAISGSDISTGIVLGGANIAAALADPTGLGNATEMAAALASPTLFLGNIKSFAGTTLLSSNLTAGVSPGADGIFGTADDNVNTSVTGGNSAITSAKVVADANSHILAKSAGSGATLVTYTLDGSGSSIVQGDPVSGAPTAVATPTSPGVIRTAQGTITVTVSGPTGTVVDLYDDPSTLDRLDTMVISAMGSSTGKGSSAVSVSVVTTSPATYNLGRVLTTDGTQLSSFVFNGTILGDVNGGPALWIDSNVTTFTVGGMPDDGTWSGQIGGNVSKLTIGTLGSGQLRVGGIVSTFVSSASVGNALLNQLGSVSPATAISQITIDPSDGSVFATDGQNLVQTNLTSGALTLTTPVATPITPPLTISAISEDSLGNLFGIATMDDMNPTRAVGLINAEGNNLHGMAVAPTGTIYAIDSQSGQDTLVTLDPSTGAETVVGVITNSFGSGYANNVQALAIDTAGDIYALTNDRDGSGGSYTTANGEAFGKITISGSVVRLANPNATGQLPVLITGTQTGPFTGFAIDQAGDFFAVRHVGGQDELDQLTLSGVASSTTVTLAEVGDVSVNGGSTGTQIVGMDFDANDNLIALNTAGGRQELIDISTTAPASSVLLDAAGLLGTSYSGFALGLSGTTYAYTTDIGGNGEFYTNPGQVPTLGIITTTGPSTGLFTQELALAQDASGTPLSGTIQSVATDSSGNLWVLMTDGQVFEYDTVSDGTLVGTGAQGIVVNNLGLPLGITQIAFDGSGQLVGMSATGNNLVHIDTTPQTMGGVAVLVATNLSDAGTADTENLAGLAYASALGRFVSYDSATGTFVSILGTTPATLGGLVAENITSATLPSNFGGRIYVNGLGAKGGGIGSLKISGAGTFTGMIDADDTIGSIAATGTVFDGSIVTHGDLTSLAITGSIAADGVISADGNLVKVSDSGDFAGSMLGNEAGAVTIGGSGVAGSVIWVARDITSLTINGTEAGTITAQTVKALKIGGTLVSGGVVQVTGDSGAVTLGGGTQAGSIFVDDGNVTGALTIGGTLAGTVAVRKSVGSAVLAAGNNGLLDVGGNITSLTINGNFTDSLVSAGTWIGADGVYNTGDDVIFGGSIGTAKIAGVFTDSLLTAGVLPREGVAAGANNIPTDVRDYTGNPNATNVADVNSMEFGGIAPSNIGTVSFSKAVVSTDATGSSFSAVVSAGTIGKVTATGSLKQVLLSDPAGAPQVVINTDPETLVQTPEISLYSSTELRIVFDQPLDTATINANTIQVIDSQTGQPVMDLSFGYFAQIGPTGQTQGVVQVFSPSGFDGSPNLVVTLVGGVTAPTITDGTGLRSALLDYDQNGTPDPAGDPFGTTIVTESFQVGAPANDDFANATELVGLPVAAAGSNVGATKEPGEPDHAGDVGGASVWWKWTAQATGSVTVSTEGSDFDTLLAVYTGTAVNNLNLVASNDDVNILNDLTSQVTFSAQAGQTYYIAVDGYGGATGNIELSLSA